ncbi:sulfur oxidation c-type cytochrome SoxX [Hydrogenophaga sp.]|uniref:sulfur oxidation c-type cytochrome SoxX n=1 Tax=Hydrogenophaga sp. TaxID=1904254 RepID=UPI0035ADE1DB
MKKTHLWALGGLAAVLALAGCAGAPSSVDLDALAQKIAKASFRDEGIVKADAVLNTDETNRLCSAADVAGKPLDEATAKRVEAENQKTIKWPSDGKFLGDWKEGEKIAQNGRGLTFTDTASVVNGGNCYNCHQITKEEISFGTIGPSLYNYAKNRGVTNPDDPASKAMVEYTWGKIWNAKAYNACSNMPRAGHKGILNETQVRHLVALLLDPNSPVNK